MVRYLVVYEADPKAVKRARWRRATTKAGLLALIPGVAGFLAASPPFVAFALAMTSAVAWCIWLEKHQL